MIIGNNFTHMQCGECGCEFYMPTVMYDARRQDKKTFHCPNGHARCFRESDADVLRRERDRLQQRLACKDDEIAHQRNQITALKGQATKLKKRIKAGVCPCCTRSFTNLKRHMESKHPDYDPAANNIVPFEKVG